MTLRPLALATFCCYGYVSNACEATYEKAYHEYSSCVTICWNAKIHLSINNTEKGLVTGTPPM